MRALVQTLLLLGLLAGSPATARGWDGGTTHSATSEWGVLHGPAVRMRQILHEMEAPYIFDGSFVATPLSDELKSFGLSAIPVCLQGISGKDNWVRFQCTTALHGILNGEAKRKRWELRPDLPRERANSWESYDIDQEIDRAERDLRDQLVEQLGEFDTTGEPPPAAVIERWRNWYRHMDWADPLGDLVH